jgi:hypothetical protein
MFCSGGSKERHCFCSPRICVHEGRQPDGLAPGVSTVHQGEPHGGTGW